MLLLRVHVLCQLEGHVFADDGGSSRDFLQHILMPQSVLRNFGPTSITVDHLRNFGPALVANVQVRESFLDGGCLRHHGPPPVGEKIKGLHAMVLVGMSLDGKRMLLQNWWTTKQFIEVSQRR
jgi:hypothetical protein